MSEPEKVDIIPAVIPQSFKDIAAALEPVQNLARQAQVDIVDGSYARGKTWPYRDHATFAKLVEDEHGLPYWDKIDFQFDLMIEDPAGQLKDFITAGATQVVLHPKSPSVMQALQIVVDSRNEDTASFPIKAGMALGCADQPEVLDPFEAQFDFVQVMGIEHEGRQGEPFDKRALYLVERLRRRYPYLPIQVDGGVSMENANALAKAGANRLVAGSAIFKAKDPAAAFQALYDEANRI